MARPTKRVTLPFPSAESFKPVATVGVGMDDDGRLLRGLQAQGYAGVVLEALGGGHVPEAMLESIAEIAQRIPVVVASRTGSGELLRATYGFTGSEASLAAIGTISAGALDANKARLLLMMLQANGYSLENDLANEFIRFT